MAQGKKTPKKAVKAAPKKPTTRGASPKGARPDRTAKSTVEPETTVPTATALAKAEDREPPREISLESFFQNVSNSVIQAQRDLDRKSDEYNRFAGGHPLVTPTVFKMPKVKASIRFAFTETNEKGFNILLFRKGQSSGFESEQTIDFEITAAPPPPDGIKALQAMTPRIDVVLDLELRKQLIALLTNVPNPSGHPGLKVNVVNRLVFLPSGVEGEYFGFAADKQTPQKFSVWKANVAEKTAEILVDRDTLESGQVPVGIATLIAFLKSSLANLQDKQEQFLAAIQV